MADFRFTVSDSYHIPLRGWMLRLKLVDGTFEPAMLAPGSRFKLIAPDGEERMVSVKGLSVTGGRQNQARVDRYGEFDVVVPAEEGMIDGRDVGIGWKAVPA